MVLHWVFLECHHSSYSLYFTAHLRPAFKFPVKTNSIAVVIITTMVKEQIVYHLLGSGAATQIRMLHSQRSDKSRSTWHFTTVYEPTASLLRAPGEAMCSYARNSHMSPWGPPRPPWGRIKSIRHLCYSRILPNPDWEVYLTCTYVVRLYWWRAHSAQMSWKPYVRY